MSTYPHEIWDAPVLLSEMLREESLCIGLHSHTKQEVLAELIDHSVSVGDLHPSYRDAALDALLRREEGRSTGLAHGVALPHASVPYVDRPMCVFGTSRPGIEFECVDGTPARLFIMLLIPPNSLQAHVKTLAGIARILNSANLRDRLMDSVDAAEVLTIIREAEGWEEL